MKLPAGVAFNAMRDWENWRCSCVVWEADGVEASVGIDADDGYTFIVNGKADGNAIGDADTQINLGMLGASLHPRPAACLVVGLGTGESAGWLAGARSRAGRRRGDRARHLGNGAAPRDGQLPRAGQPEGALHLQRCP